MSAGVNVVLCETTNAATDVDPAIPETKLQNKRTQLQLQGSLD